MAARASGDTLHEYSLQSVPVVLERSEGGQDRGQFGRIVHVPSYRGA